MRSAVTRQPTEVGPSVGLCRKAACSNRGSQALMGCSWDIEAGHVPAPCIAPPSTGRYGQDCAAGFPAWQSVAELARQAWPHLRRRPLCIAIPGQGPTGGGALASGLGDLAAVRRGPVGPTGSRCSAEPDRLEVSAWPAARRPWLRRHGAERVPHAPGHGRGRDPAVGCGAGDRRGASAAQGWRPPAHRRHARPGRRPGAEPARVCSRDAAACAGGARPGGA
jgi:hypothetical protein